jgi:hypothetical protein
MMVARSIRLARHLNTSAFTTASTTPLAVNIALNKRLTSTKISDWPKVLSIAAISGANFNAVNYATTLSKLGKLRSRSRHVRELKQDARYRDILKSLSGIFSDPAFFSDQTNIQAIANIVHALAKLKEAEQTVLGAVSANSPFIVEHGTPQAVANIAWAFATLKYPSSFMFKDIEKHADRLVEDGTPQEIAIMAWSFATLSIPAPSMFSKIEAQFLGVAGTEILKPQDIANTAWAFATLRHDAPALFSLFDARSEFVITLGTAQGIANTALAFAEVGTKPDSFFVCLENHVDRFLRTANNLQVCTVCWSLAMLGLLDQHNALLQAMWKKVTSDDAAKFRPFAVHQLIRVEMTANACGVELLSPVPPALRLRMAEAIESANRRGTGVSRFEDEYSALLDEIGFKHEREVSPFGQGQMLAFDMASSELKIAVECDGPFHFMSSGRETGRTVAKRILAESLGWTVVNIPYKDNEAIEALEEAEADKKESKKQYLRERLRGAGWLV